MIYVAIWIGGAAGGVLRYLLDTLALGTGVFPMNTLVINLVGSFILGIFYGLAGIRKVKPWLRVGFGTGFIGAFTTFSTFCFDTARLSSAHFGLAVVYATSSILGGPLLALLGDQIAVAAVRRAGRQPEEVSV